MTKCRCLRRNKESVGRRKAMADWPWYVCWCYEGSLSFLFSFHSFFLFFFLFFSFFSRSCHFGCETTCSAQNAAISMRMATESLLLSIALCHSECTLRLVTHRRLVVFVVVLFGVHFFRYSRRHFHDHRHQDAYACCGKWLRGCTFALVTHSHSQFGVRNQMKKKMFVSGFSARLRPIPCPKLFPSWKVRI